MRCPFGACRQLLFGEHDAVNPLHGARTHVPWHHDTEWVSVVTWERLSVHLVCEDNIPGLRESLAQRHADVVVFSPPQREEAVPLRLGLVVIDSSGAKHVRESNACPACGADAAIPPGQAHCLSVLVVVELAPAVPRAHHGHGDVSLLVLPQLRE